MHTQNLWTARFNIQRKPEKCWCLFRNLSFGLFDHKKSSMTFPGLYPNFSKIPGLSRTLFKFQDFPGLVVAMILFPSLREGKNCKISLGYPDANVSKFLMGWEFKCNLPCLLNLYNRYWNQVDTKHENLFSILVSQQKQATE